MMSDYKKEVLPIKEDFIVPGECFNGPMTEIDKQVVLEANPSLDQAAVTLGVKNEKNNAGKDRKRELNREDIEAVEFLASEFSKESQSLKVAEQKDLADFETVDSTMLEVAAVQGVSDQTSLTTQCGEFSDAETTHEEHEMTDYHESQLTRKRRSKSDDREFKCGYCAKSFTMRIALEKHLVVHGAKLPWQCPECPKGFMKSSDYKDHCNKIHHNFRPFPCHICGKTLSNLGILKNHQGLHTGERPFKCSAPGCNKAFLTKTNLEDHLRKHVNAREFQCETCHKRFNLKGDLRQHEKVHKQEKPFECEFCKMTFPRGPSLWRHRRTHTGEKPYACDICGKRFARMENCQEHRRIHTGERPLVCKVCGKSFRDSGNFSNHKKIHEDGYVPRKKRPINQKKSKETFHSIAYTSTCSDVAEKADNNVDTSSTEADVTSQEVAFIVAPMHVDDSTAEISLSAAATTSESSYVQVGNFLLTMEMEAAFKHLLQQHGGNNEFVTLAMTSGKGLELVSDPSQVGAIMQAAALEAQGCVKEEGHGTSEESCTVADIDTETDTNPEQFSVVSSDTEITVRMSET